MERRLTYQVGQLPSGAPVLRATPAEACVECVDGWLVVDDGGAGYAKACGCRKVERLAAAINGARFPAWAINARADRWLANGGPKDRPTAGQLVSWAGSFAPRTRGKILVGTPGVGKSWLAATLALDVAERGYSTRWVQWVTLLDEIRDGYAQKRPEHDITAPLLAVDLLVVDDLGQGTATEWSYAAIERLLGRRLEDGSTTIITANLDPRVEIRDSMAEMVGDRVWSRMGGACDLHRIGGADLRMARMP